MKGITFWAFRKTTNLQTFKNKVLSTCINKLKKKKNCKWPNYCYHSCFWQHDFTGDSTRVGLSRHFPLFNFLAGNEYIINRNTWQFLTSYKVVNTFDILFCHYELTLEEIPDRRLILTGSIGLNSFCFQTRNDCFGYNTQLGKKGVLSAVQLRSFIHSPLKLQVSAHVKPSL